MLLMFYQRQYTVLNMELANGVGYCIYSFIPFGSITDRQEVDVEVVLQLLGGLIRVTSFFHVESGRKKSKDTINFRHEGTEMKKRGDKSKKCLQLLYLSALWLRLLGTFGKRLGPGLSKIKLGYLSLDTVNHKFNNIAP